MTGSPDRPRALATRAALWLFLALSGFFVATSPPAMDVRDTVVMFGLTRAIVDEGALSFPPLPGVEMPEQRAPEGADGGPRIWSKYGLAPSLAMVPAYALSRLLLPLATEAEAGVFDTPATVEGRWAWELRLRTDWGDDRSFRRLWYATDAAHFELAFGAWMANLTAAWVVAGLCALGLVVGARLGGRLSAGLLAGLALAFASPFWVYAYQMWSEPLVALLLLAAAHQAGRWREDGDDRRPVLIGLLLGTILVTKVALGVLWLGMAAGLWAARPERDPRTLARRALRVGLGALPPVALLLAYNQARFGDPLETGYRGEVDEFITPFWEGLYGLLLSPARGLLIYFPLLLVAPLALPRLRRRAPELFWTGALGLPCLLLLYARWWSWEGGWCWGPRFLLPALPFFVIALACLVEPPLRRLGQGLLGLGLLAGLLVTWSGVRVENHDWHQWMNRYFQDRPELLRAAGADHYYHFLRWDWDFAPVVALWAFPVRETMLLPAAIQQPGVVLAILLSAAGVSALGAIGLVRTWREAQAEGLA